MKHSRIDIDLRDRNVRAILVGLAAERKNHKAIIKLVRKLAERDLRAVCEHQPIRVTKQHGCFRVQDSHGKAVFGRERKTHSGTHHNHNRGNK